MLADALITTGSRSQTLNAWLRWRAVARPSRSTHAAYIGWQLATPTMSLALMLPLTGRLANVGRAVRDRFVPPG